MVRAAIVLLMVVWSAGAGWGRACTSRAAGNWSATGNGTTTGTWTSTNGCNTTVPGLGDTVTIGHAVVQDVANLVVGVNGAAPNLGYLVSLGPLGGGSGYTSCSVSGTGLTGGTATWSGQIGCTVYGGVVYAFIKHRGVYTACPTSAAITASGGSGATTSVTPTCNLGGGTPAVAVSNSSTASLTIAADTYVRGPLTLIGANGSPANALIINPGASLFMDMTQAGGAMYRIEMPNYYRTISADCSSQHISGLQNKGCSIQGYGGATSIQPGFLSGYSNAYPKIMLNNVLLKNVGDANTQNQIWLSSVQNSIFDVCGPIDYTTSAASDVVVWNGNYHKNSPQKFPEDVPSNLHLTYTAANSGGTRQIINSVFDGSISNPTALGTVGALKDFTITGSYFGGAIWDLQTLYTWASFQNNFLRAYRLNQIADDGSVYHPAAGPESNTYWLLDAGHWRNPHFSQPASGGPTFSGLVGDTTALNYGDSGEWMIGTATIQNSVFPCGPAGYGNSELTSPLTTATVFASNHNTWCGGKGVFGMLDVNETQLTGAGNITMLSNIAWETASGAHTSMKLYTTNTTTGQTTDVCTTTNAATSNCDYNAGYLTAATANCPSAVPGNCTNQGRGYVAKWSYTPGYHDVDGQNPGFVDPARNAATFDRGYLGKALASTYSGGATYVLGDLASNTDSNYYGGTAINYRCTNPSGCTSGEAPGQAYAENASCGASSCVVNVSGLRLSIVDIGMLWCSGVTVTSYSTSGGPPYTSVTLNYSGTGGTCRVISNWRRNWEFASLYWLREAIAAGTTYTDGAIGCVGCNPVQALVGWVKAGYVVQNPLFWKTAHDSTDIGATNTPTTSHMSGVNVTVN